jgi:protein involved in ribonucleotide reduction
LIFEFEFSGTKDDITEFKKEVFKYWNLQSWIRKLKKIHILN